MAGKHSLIRNADWVIAWDKSQSRHVYRNGIDIHIKDDRIAYLGPATPESSPLQEAEIIDGRGCMVMPGLVDLHAHPSTEPGYRGVREDHGCLEHYMASLFERAQAFRLSEVGRRAALEVAYSELLQSGVTTLMDLTIAVPGWEDVMRRSGMRVYVAPRYSSGRWKMKGRTEIDYDWTEKAGRQNFEKALHLIASLEAEPYGRLRGVVYPAQVDTVAEDLFRDSVAVAKETGRPITTHAAQAVLEFREMVKRHGVTPIQWLGKIGFLGPNATIGHAIFLDEHSAIGWHTRRDLDLLAESGTTVAHCPSPFARYGNALQDFGRYRERGVNLGIGTDVAPHNLIEEMRLAVQLARVQAHDIRAADTAAVFEAATVGGARALGRDDLGRLVSGAKADFVLVDVNHPNMAPARDPLRALIWSSADRAVKRVYVDGVPVMVDGKPVGLNREEAAGVLAQEQDRMLADAPKNDYAHRTAQEIAPLSLPIMGS